MANNKDLQQAWTELYSKILPSLARARDPAQRQWPVRLDHCFARIILDNTVGEGREQWDKRLKRPAVKNMSREQLQNAIELAGRIKDGKEDLVALDLQSLEARGKSDKKYKEKSPASGADDLNSSSPGNVRSPRRMLKRKNAENDDADAALGFSKKPKTSGKQATLSFALTPKQAGRLPSPPASEDEKLDLLATIRQIQSHQALTPYRKRLYGALLSVPKGRYTTYAVLSDFLGSSARAVGSGMRNNPFAPDVPCHRVLASDGSIGGFGGSWGADGENTGKKHELLNKEGVKFDSKGKVRGPPFEDFVDLLEGG